MLLAAPTLLSEDKTVPTRNDQVHLVVIGELTFILNIFSQSASILAPSKDDWQQNTRRRALLGTLLDVVLAHREVA